MSKIYLQTEGEFPVANFSKTGFLDKFKMSDAELSLDCEFQLFNEPSKRKEESDFHLIPLNKANKLDSGFRILSVSKRMEAFDRLLIPQKFSKKNIPVALKELAVIAIEERTLLQISQIFPKKQDLELISLRVLTSEPGKFTEYAIILPWYIDEKPWLEKGYHQLDLHPAEFTPEAGSGCWAILGKDGSNQSKKEIIRSLHHPASLVFTNTERKFIRDFDIPDLEVLGTHLESPLEDKYHLYICLKNNSSGEVFWFDYPSSTFGDMSTEAIEALKIHLQQQTLI
ncbi:MAG: hypothetical protein EA362_09170 [Saprospirales bacterium]|nr:MAG: hypothetical protein EA362_09170 [Saprospirales bacterium]